MGKSLAIGAAALLGAGLLVWAGPPVHGSKAFAQATGEETVLASAAFLVDPALRLDLLEAKRVSGGALLVRWRVANTSGGGGGLVRDEGKDIGYDVPGKYYLSYSYFIDHSENKKYHILRDSNENWLSGVYSGTYGPGSEYLNWAKFPAPPARSDRISVHISGFEPMEDVPISE